MFDLEKKKHYANLINYREVKKNTTLDGYMVNDAEPEQKDTDSKVKKK